MNDLVLWLGAGAAGVIAGLVFFIGLWVTLQRLPTARSPAPLLLGSLVLRFGLVLTVLYSAAKVGGWQAVLAATAGFTLARLLTMSRFISAESASTGDDA